MAPKAIMLKKRGSLGKSPPVARGAKVGAGSKGATGKESLSKKTGKAVAKEPAAKVEEEEEVEEDADEEEEECEEEEEEEEASEEEEAPAAPVSSPKRIATKSSPHTASSPKRSASSASVVAVSPKRVVSEFMQVEYVVGGMLHAPLAEGLVQLRRKLIRCDAAIRAGGGARIPVHAVVLASQSQVLDRKLDSGHEIDLGSVSHDAAHILVQWIYGEISVETYAPSNAKVNEEVLRLASELGLPLLAQICSTRLARDVTIKNVVERVRLCEAFGLPELRASLVTALVDDRLSLDAVAREPATLAHPALMRELLACLATKAIEDLQADEGSSGGSRPEKKQRVTS